MESDYYTNLDLGSYITDEWVIYGPMETTYYYVRQEDGIISLLEIEGNYEYVDDRNRYVISWTIHEHGSTEYFEALSTKENARIIETVGTNVSLPFIIVGTFILLISVFANRTSILSNNSGRWNIISGFFSSGGFIPRK